MISHSLVYFEFIRGVTLEKIAHLHCLIVLYILTCLTSINLYSENTPVGERQKVLLLNSYHKGYLWTDEVTRGVEETFAGKEIDLHIEFMDTKRQFDPVYLDLLGQLLSRKHDRFNYDVVITSDNNAYDFFMDRGRQIFKNTPLVFCGLNYLMKDELRDVTGITGVNEKANISGNLELIKQLHPECNRIVIITDNTTTGKKVQDEVIKQENRRESYDPEFQMVFDMSSNELIQYISTLDDKTIVYFTLFARDRDGIFFEYDQATEMISRNSAVPVYGTWNFQMNHGIIGGYLTDGYAQGRVASEKSLEILSGKSVDVIPITYETPSSLRFDYRQLERFGISIDKLPPQSLILNQPVTFFYQYKSLIFIILGLFFFLLLAFLGVAYGFIRSKKAETQIRQSEENLRTTLYSIGDAVISTDLQGRVVRMNPIAEVLTGWDTEEAEGKPITEVFHIIHAITGEPVGNPVSDVFNLGKIILLEDHTSLVTRNGKEFKIADSAAPILDDSGDITGAVLVFRNVTKEYRIQQKLEYERNFARKIIEKTPSLICGINFKGITTFINPAIVKISGYVENELIGTNWWKLFYPGEEYRQVEKLFKILLGGEVVNYEMSLTCRDGSKKDIVWNSYTKMDEEGNPLEFIGFGHDITDRKQAEYKLFETNKELVKHKENLEELVAERTLELRESLNYLKQAQNQLVESEKMAALGGLVAGVAHEINTPLGIVVTAASHLEERSKEFEQQFLSGKLFKADFEDYINLAAGSSKIMLSNMKRAANLIQSFKQVAVDQSSEERREFEIKEYIDEILMSLNYQLTKKTYNIVVNCPDGLYVDSFPGAISQIFTNLIMNSLNHGFEGMDEGTISINISENEEKMKIIYEDTGCGIPEENLIKIFDPFFTTKRGFGGSGLGMHIVYNLVTQSLKGSIKCSSATGEGARFEIDFPCRINSVE